MRPLASPLKCRFSSRTSCGGLSRTIGRITWASSSTPRGPPSDKLFEKYKAQRPPMPDDLSVQIPYVRKLCEAMHLPILEFQGYEADDVIGALATQGAKKQ